MLYYFYFVIITANARPSIDVMFTALAIQRPKFNYLVLLLILQDISLLSAVEADDMQHMICMIGGCN